MDPLLRPLLEFYTLGFYERPVPEELPKKLLQNIDNFTSYGPLKMRFSSLAFLGGKMESIHIFHF